MNTLARALLLSFALAVNTASAQVEEIAAAASVDSIITKIRNALSEVISEAESSASVVGFSFATDAKILLQNLDIMAINLEGQIFSDLNATQRSLITQLLQLSDEANQDFRGHVDALNAAVNELGAEISRIPGVSERPFVMKYSPSHILNAESAYDVQIFGSLLNSELMTLQFGATPCLLVKAIESELNFRCPVEAFYSSGNAWTSGRLSLVKPAPWYAFWRDNNYYDYTIGIMTVQEKLADYILEVYEKRDTDVSVDRVASNSYRNGHCKGDKSRVWAYRPAPGCKIDVGKVNVTDSKSSNSVYEGIINLTSDGFQVRGEVRNSGQCGPFGIPKDGRGLLKVNVSWVDLCPASGEVALEPLTGEIYWGQEKDFRFSSDTTKFVLTVIQTDSSDPERRTVKKITGDGGNSWFTATYDLGNKILVVKPRDLVDAMK